MGIVPLPRVVRAGRPLDDADDTVSNESAPFSDALVPSSTDGTPSPGASKPFFVGTVDVDLELSENKFFAFGADATRRMKRDAFAPMAFGESGPDRDGVGGGCANSSCEAAAV